MADKHTILLVEDDRDDEELAIRAIERTGVSAEVVVVHDGAEALDYVFGAGEFTGHQTDRHPSLVLLDLKMPRKDGLQVLQEIQHLHEEDPTVLCPVVVFTSSGAEDDILSAYRFGANGYVVKPVDFSRYISAVQELVRYWLGVNLPPPWRREPMEETSNGNPTPN